MTVLLEAANAKRHREAFSAWADVYDEQKNPLLMLEERFLLELLPEAQDRDVLDTGCGTGRWLANLSRRFARTLQGIDPSPEMLSRAAAKNIPGVELSPGSCTDIPAMDAAFDILLASFVLSYVDDLRSAARELARVARPGADLFLSDMHPETAAALHWKRSFRNGEDEVELPAIAKMLPDVLAAFEQNGFVVRAILEPSFGAAERDIFLAHGKVDRFIEAEHLPAIYLLHLTKRPSNSVIPRIAGEPPIERILLGGRCAVGARETVAAAVATRGSVIETVSSRPLAGRAPLEASIDLSGYLLLPGLINAHDHLEFSLFPRLGAGPYENAGQWALDIQDRDAATIALHREIPKHTRLWWGGLRNLLSGVTTVCHHNPLDPLLLAEKFPVRVLAHFGWEHSLGFGEDVLAAHRRTREDEPFVIHACEGIDARSKDELQKLDELGVLTQQTVLVHGLTLDTDEATLLNERGASLVTCPSSNAFLFERLPSREVLESITQLALGSDSPLTAAGDLLDELRFASEVCQVSQQRLYSSVTKTAASILRLKNGEGGIRPGARADVIAVKDRRGDPEEILCSLSTSDMELVILSGRVRLASASLYERLPAEDRKGLEPLSVNGDIRWLRAPIASLLGEAESILGKGAVRVGGKPVCQPSL